MKRTIHDDPADRPESEAERQLPLTIPVFQILLALADQELHGYAVIQDIAERTGGEVRLTASTLYGAVARMLDAGLIEELQARPEQQRDDPRRRYYRITAFGRDVARLEAARLVRYADMARDKRLLPRARGVASR
jgi:DNA-binding PadR family transcriptional regulator